jgi:hypothetical protein
MGTKHKSVDTKHKHVGVCASSTGYILQAEAAEHAQAWPMPWPIAGSSAS